MTAQADLAHVDDWVFDLDNTLYPAECNLFDQIDAKITLFVMNELNLGHAEAKALQKQYYAEHGTTLNGLMRGYDLDPARFLDFVHDIDHSPLSPDQVLIQAIENLPGKRYVFTNGSVGHAEKVLRSLRLDHAFDGLFGIVEGGYAPKPERVSFERMLNRFSIDPCKAVMFEDLSRNLQTAYMLGFTTVLVRSGKDWSHEPPEARPAGLDEHPDHVHFVTDNLPSFLKGAQTAPAHP
jgi:putative hydrolase of the HAD superfamily